MSRAVFIFVRKMITLHSTYTPLSYRCVTANILIGDVGIPRKTEA